MNPNLLDNPLVLSVLFHPRRAEPGQSLPEGVHDGTIPVGDGVTLGYRLTVHTPDAPVILYFHGNGEVAPDYDTIAPLYHQAGASLIVVDYRGYGWSTGQPRLGTLLPDAAAVVAALPDLLARAGAGGGVWLVMGRSLGSACAVHVAHKYPELFAGLIIESGFAHILPLLARLGLPVETLQHIPDPFGNVRKLGEITLPLLVIHGERDSLIPIANGQALYDASPAIHKTIVRIPQAGHNDLLFYGIDAYFAAVARFIAGVTDPQETG